MEKFSNLLCIEFSITSFVSDVFSVKLLCKTHAALTKALAAPSRNFSCSSYAGIKILKYVFLNEKFLPNFKLWPVELLEENLPTLTRHFAPIQNWHPLDRKGDTKK